MRVILFCFGLVVLMFGVFVSLMVVDLFWMKVFEGVKVYFIMLVDGVIVDKIFIVKFGLKGMGVVLVGVDMLDIGYYYLLVDLKEQLVMNLLLLMIDNICYFGKGQIEIEIILLLGKYIL